MLTLNQYQSIAKNGITFKLSNNQSHANVYKNDKLVGTIYNNQNTIFFCGTEFIETTSRDIIEFLKAVNLFR